MKSKFEYSNFFIKNDEILICPICKKKLYLKDHSLICENAHNFNLSKKGITNLVSHSHIKESKIYNYDLFFSRRCFIQKMFYQKLYDKIAETEIEKIMEKVRIETGLAPEDYEIKRIKKKCTPPAERREEHPHPQCGPGRGVN